MVSSLLRGFYGGYVPQPNLKNPQHVIKKYGLFKFIENLNATPWHVQSPLSLSLFIEPLPKFKYYHTKLSVNCTWTIYEHISCFSNSCHNIGSNVNDVCMRLFVKRLKNN